VYVTAHNSSILKQSANENVATVSTVSTVSTLHVRCSQSFHGSIKVSGSHEKY